MIRDPFLSVCQVHIVSRHGKSRCPLQRHPYGHSIPLPGIFAARSAPCPNPPPLRRHIPKFSASPKKCRFGFRALRSVIPRYRIPLGPFVLAQIPPRAAPSRSPAQFSASANAPPASAYLTMVALLLLGVYYHKMMCCLAGAAFDFRWPNFHFLHDGRMMTVESRRKFVRPAASFFSGRVSQSPNNTAACCPHAHRTHHHGGSLPRERDERRQGAWGD